MEHHRHDSGIHRSVVLESRWPEYDPRVSLELIKASARSKADAVIDVGGEGAMLIDALLAQEFSDLTVLGGAAAETSRVRAPQETPPVTYLHDDLTTWVPTRAYDVWHDRGLFQFLSGAPERAAYREAVAAAVRPGGHVIVAAFAEQAREGHEALSLRRYSAAGLINEFDGLLRPVETRSERWAMASGVELLMVFVRFRKS